MTPVETLAEFHIRTDTFTQFSLPSEGELHTHPNLHKKVDREGNFLPFYGNTVVFCLPDDIKDKLKRIQKELYHTCRSALAQPLEPATFHITLHDLVNGESPTLMDREVPQIQQRVLEVVRKLQKETDTIRLQSSSLFQMVSTSMVLGFEPADEESCHLLMTYYERLQEVFWLDYPLTPHVTLAYFKPGIIRHEDIRNLNRIIDLGKTQPTITLELSGSSLAYQLFSSMNHYWTV